MASKTPRITLGPAWQNIGGTSVAVAGRVISGEVQLEYCTSEPAAGDLGIPYRPGQDFSISIATGDQLWAKASNRAAVIAVMQRGA